MATDDHDRSVTFVLAGTSQHLTRSAVETRLAGIVPRPVETYAVQVNGVWYPVRQAFAIGAGLAPDTFNSHTARRHLQNLGFATHGNVQHRDQPVINPVDENPPAVEPGPIWHTEARIQAAVVASLRASGWHIASEANTATRERGIDIVATKHLRIAGIEVKGFPARTYANPARSRETKPTQPSTQAGHWYGQAVLAAMRLRTRQPDYVSAIALPDFPRYRNLFDETASPLAACAIHMLWVHQDGSVDGLNALNEAP